MTLRVFGLTGGIGSGKSTVGGLYRERGVAVIDADHLARRAVEKDSDGLRQVVERFGPDVLTGAGELDRARLAERVFSNVETRKALDAIVHPIVRALAFSAFREIERRAEPLACYEVPLLYEVGLEKTLTKVVVVSAPETEIRARLAARDGLDRARIEARISAQMPLAEKVRRADFVIENDASLALLRARSDGVFDALCEALGVPGARYPRGPGEAD